MRSGVTSVASTRQPNFNLALSMRPISSNLVDATNLDIIHWYACKARLADTDAIAVAGRELGWEDEEEGRK